MNMHKNIRLTPHHQAIWLAYIQEKKSVTSLARRYLSECVYTDNGTEYKGSVDHAFGVACYENGIGQKFTRVACPQANGKAEQVICTLMERWNEKQSSDGPEHRQKELCRFLDFYNTVKLHGSLVGDTPFEGLTGFILKLWCKQRNNFLHVNRCRIAR
ncbi:integrase core domain-containing protein [Kingella denitrificans]|uniref:integrase core domain-containing protein n=1 Tax=Kingella denitrificans TaxID=502 RepID=UPI002889BCDA|nr:integrase core domain-containing protein [Kingella denitrificans]